MGLESSDTMNDDLESQLVRFGDGLVLFSSRTRHMLERTSISVGQNQVG
jgi:hypothetical protein